jgi:hypothetical protein
MEWLSIESAPKDGMIVLLAHPDGDVVCVTPGWFYDDTQDWWEMNSHPSDYVDKPIPNATHWMPLPEPPTS